MHENMKNFMSIHLVAGRVSLLTLLWSQVVLAVLDSLHLRVLWPRARLNYLETGYGLCNTNRLPGSLCDCNDPTTDNHKGSAWLLSREEADIPYTRRGAQQVQCLVCGHGLSS